MIANYRGQRFDLTGVAIALAGALLILVGSMVGHLRPSWFMGVGTPWTLSSESTWIRTNRLGGRLLMICGALFFVAGLARRPWMVWSALAAVGLTAVTVMVYSYHVWRSAPDKTPPGGMPPRAAGA